MALISASIQVNWLDMHLSRLEELFQRGDIPRRDVLPDNNFDQVILMNGSPNRVCQPYFTATLRELNDLSPALFEALRRRVEFTEQLSEIFRRKRYGVDKRGGHPMAASLDSVCIFALIDTRTFPTDNFRPLLQDLRLIHHIVHSLHPDGGKLMRRLFQSQVTQKKPFIVKSLPFKIAVSDGSVQISVFGPDHMPVGEALNHPPVYGRCSMYDAAVSHARRHMQPLPVHARLVHLQCNNELEELHQRFDCYSSQGRHCQYSNFCRPAHARAQAVLSAVHTMGMLASRPTHFPALDPPPSVPEEEAAALAVQGRFSPDRDNDSEATVRVPCPPGHGPFGQARPFVLSIADSNDGVSQVRRFLIRDGGYRRDSDDDEELHSDPSEDFNTSNDSRNMEVDEAEQMSDPGTPSTVPRSSEALSPQYSPSSPRFVGRAPSPNFLDSAGSAEVSSSIASPRRTISNASNTGAVEIDSPKRWVPQVDGADEVVTGEDDSSSTDYMPPPAAMLEALDGRPMSDDHASPQEEELEEGELRLSEDEAEEQSMDRETLEAARRDSSRTINTDSPWESASSLSEDSWLEGLLRNAESYASPGTGSSDGNTSSDTPSDPSIGSTTTDTDCSCEYTCDGECSRKRRRVPQGTNVQWICTRKRPANSDSLDAGSDDDGPTRGPKVPKL